MTARKSARKVARRKKSAARKAVPRKKSAGRRAPTPTKKATISSMSVHLGHVFSLRPPVKTSFRQEDFRTARQLLRDETYASIQEAARAVAEKALAMTHEKPPKRGFKSSAR